MASGTVAIGNFVTGDTLAFTNTAGITGSYNAGTGVLTLTGTDTLANYQAALRSVKYSSSSDDPTVNNTKTSRTITWSATDANSDAVGAATSAGVTSTVNVTAVNDAPVLTAGATLAYTEQAAGAVIDNTITLADVDDTQMASATVAIGNFVTGDTLAFTNTAGITGSYNAGTGVLTLTGTDTLANYQAALRSVKYSSSSDDPTVNNTKTSRTITWSATDANSDAVGAATSAGVTSTVNVTAVNDAPVLTAGATLAYTEQAAGAVIDNTITLADVDDTQMASATVTIGNFVTGDALAFTNTAGITGSYNAGTGVLTLTGTDTLANYQAALRSVKYSSSSDDPTVNNTKTSRTITWTATDANSDAVGAATSAGVTSTVNVTAVNDAPVLTAGATLAYTEQAAGAVIDNTITLADVDDTQMASATVAIGNFVTGDTLAFTNTAGITGSYNAGTGVLTLTGTDTLANYQAALRSVKYSSSSDDPTVNNTKTSRTITWSATDANSDAVGAATSAGVTSTVNVTAVNDAPVLTAGATLAYTEQAAGAVIDNTITLADVDDTQMASATVAIGNFVTGDTLAFTNTAGITGSYNAGTGVLTLTGTDTLANYQAALRSVKYSSSSDDPTVNNTKTSRTITWSATDANSDAVGAATSAGVTSTVNVTAVNDAPVLTAGATLAYTEQAAGAVIDNTITLADVDDTQMASATVTIGNFVTGDALAFTNTAGITGSYNAGTGVLTLTGTDTLANYQAALRSVKYSSSSDDPTVNNTKTSRTITWSATDANSDAVGAATSAGVTSTVNVTAVNDAPVLTAGATLAYTEQAAGAVIDNTITLADVDDTQMASATVAIGNFVTGDTLAFTNTAGITGSYNAGTGVLTLTGTDTLANYQAALRSVKYSSSSDDPTVNNTKTSRTITWSATDANSDAVGAATSAGVTSTVNVTAVNDAPVLTAGATLAYTEQAAGAVIDNTITLADVDDTQMASATVTIGNFVTGDALAFTNTAGITGSYNAGTGVLTLTGTDTLANYQAALRSVKYSSSSDDPTVNNTKTSRTITWSATDANSDAVGAATSAGVTSTVNVTAVNDAPVLTAGATLAYTEQAAGAVIDNTITLADVDDTQMASATVAIGNFVTGDTLAFTNTAGITGSYNAGTGVLTLTGTDTLANYQAALRSVKYSSSSDDPTVNNTKTSRTITWSATDANSDAVGAATSAGVTSTVNVTAVNDAPVLTAGATLAYTEQAAGAVIDNTITLADVDDTQMVSATVAIGNFVTGDTLAFTNTAGITGSYNAGTGVLTLTGTDTLANYQAALRSAKYSSGSDDPTVNNTKTSRTITWTATDANSDAVGAATSAGVTSTVNVTAVNDAPVLTAGATLAYTEQAAGAVIDNTIALADVDDTQMASATVTIGNFVTGDALAFTNTAGITGSYNAGTGVLTLTGTDTLANYQAALRSVKY